MLIGIDMLGVQSGGDRQAGRLGRRLVSALLAGDSTHRYVLYTHAGLPTEGVPSARNALKVALGTGPEGPLKPRVAVQRVLDHNPDGLDWLVLLDPFHPDLGGLPPESPLNGLRVASMVAELPSDRSDDRKVAPLRDHDAIMAYSGSIADDCRRRLPNATGRVARIGLAGESPGSVKNLGGPLGEADGDKLGRLGIVGPFLLAGSTGGLDRSNLGGVLDSYRRLPLVHQKSHQLVIVGRLDDPWAAVAYLHDQGCAEGLVLAGPVDEKTFRTLAERCSAFVSPGLGEGSDIALIEALGCGAPVVAGRAGSQPTTLDGAGLLADPSDPSEIADQVASLLSDADLARELRRKALARSAAFSWGPVVEAFFETLKEVAPSKSGRKHRFDGPHDARPRLAIFAAGSDDSSPDHSLDDRIAREWRSSHDVDLYFEPRDASLVERVPVDLGGFNARLFLRNDAILDYDAVIHVLADIFSTKTKRGRLRARPGLVVLRDESSLDRIGLEVDRLEPVGFDVEAEVACQRLHELFLTPCRLAVRSLRNWEAIRLAFPEYADRVVALPAAGPGVQTKWIEGGEARPQRGSDGLLLGLPAPSRPTLAAMVDDVAYLEAR